MHESSREARSSGNVLGSQHTWTYHGSAAVTSAQSTTVTVVSGAKALLQLKHHSEASKMALCAILSLAWPAGREPKCVTTYCCSVLPA